MTELDIAREKISSIDAQMAELFQQRMEMSRVIGAYKLENALPVRDEKREKLLTEKNLAYMENEEIRDYYKEFLTKVIELSCEYQQTLFKAEG